MRFQCLGCNKPFRWTAKKIVSKVIEGYELPVTMEYVVCPHCESFDFEEYRNGAPKKTTITKPVPPVKYPAPVQQFDPEDLMRHSWKGKKIGDRQYAKANENYGWDFKDQFNNATLDALEKGIVTIADKVFELKGKIVTMQKVKQ